MASYLIYLPGKRGASPDLLHEVGLGDLCTDGAPLFVDVPSGGPDGGRGVLCGWDDPLDPSKNQPLAVRMDLQEWSPAKPHDGLEAGRFWLGALKSSPVKPKDIQRRRTYSGLNVLLADGNEWAMPVVKLLPKRHGLASSGRFGSDIRKEYRALCESAESIEAQLHGQDGAEISIEGGWRFGVDALALNYRVNSDVVDWLDLVWDEHYLNFVGAPVELQLVREVEAQKKTGSAITSVT